MYHQARNGTLEAILEAHFFMTILMFWKKWTFLVASDGSCV